MQLLSSSLMTHLARWAGAHRLPRRQRTRAAVTLAGVLALAAAGCASVAETLIAPQDEYLAYRRVRTSDQLEQRLAESWAYMDRYPRGQWAVEVRRWFLRAELTYYEDNRESAAGLAAYLRVLPNGPHAAEARAALDVYRARARQDQTELLGLAAQYTEERLAALAAERERARDAVPAWLGRLLAIETWGERTSHLDSDFLFAWRIDPPGAKCSDRVCTRSESIPFSLPGGGEDASRVMVLDVVLRLDANGGVEQAALAGPGLFTRLYEASTSRRVGADDAAARVDAIAFAVDVVRGAAERKLPAGRCAQDAVAPTVLSLGCGGWSVQVIAAAQPQDDDTIVVQGAGK